MGHYKYTAKNNLGRSIRGSMDGNSQTDVLTKLKKMGLYEAQIRESTNPVGNPFFFELFYLDSQGKIHVSQNKKVPVRDIIIFSRQLSTMLSAGIPIIQSLDIIANQQTTHTFATIIRKIKTTIENGSKFSEALAHYPQVFSGLFVSMVEAGEASGKLDEVLKNISNHIDKSEKLKNKVRAASRYPVFVLFFAMVIVGFLLTVVVPRFSEQFRAMGHDLPELTQIIMLVSQFIVDQIFIILAIGIAAVFALRAWINSPKGRLQFDTFILKLPGIGNLIKKVSIGRFCSTLASMLSSGVNLLEALSISAGSVNNVLIENFIHGIRRRIEHGEKLSEPMKENHVFPEIVVSMVSIGEATGSLDEMLHKVSDFYEEEVDYALNSVLALIEPILLIVVGAIVGTIVVGLYLPIFDMASTIEF